MVRRWEITGAMAGSQTGGRRDLVVVVRYGHRIAVGETDCRQRAEAGGQSWMSVAFGRICMRLRHKVDVRQTRLGGGFFFFLSLKLCPQPCVSGK